MEGIINGAFEQVGEAAGLGTNIHAAIEAHFKNEPVPDEMQVYVRPTVALLEREGIKLLQHELRLVNTSDGYAGTTDAQLPDGQATFEAGLLSYLAAAAGSMGNVTSFSRAARWMSVS